MRDDLREAWDVVRWAETHIPVLQERFISWQGRGAYELVMEPDPDDLDWEFLVAYPKEVDSLILGDIGAVINSIRTSLDILMFAVLARHRPKPNGKTHFPIYATDTQFLDAVNVLEANQRISSVEAAAIKKTKAYRGGDKLLYPLHQLDILRKHIRFLEVEPVINSAHVTVLDSHLYVHHSTLDDKTILYRFPARRFRPAKGNTSVAAEIFFNEPALLQTKQPAIHVLRNFGFRVRALIEDFP